MRNEKVVIIGAGPAGVSCAVQLKRYGLAPFLIERDEVGGLLLNANMVENYPGFPEGISGVNLAKLFGEQLEKYSIVPHILEVLNVDFNDKNFILETDKGEIAARTLVVASGTVPKKLNIVNPDIMGGIFYDVKGLRSVKDKDICIIGAGDVAFDYALSLSFFNRVTVLCRKEEISCIPCLLEKVKARNNIQVLTGCEVKEINEEGGKLVLYCSSENDVIIRTDVVVIAIGRGPNIGFLSQKLIEVYDTGEEEKNLYFVGDVSRGILRQVGVAVGDGLRVAMEIFQGKAEERIGETVRR